MLNTNTHNNKGLAISPKIYGYRDRTLALNPIINNQTMKQKLPLNTVLNLKNVVEKMIEKTNEEIHAKNTGTMKLDGLINHKVSLEAQLVSLKEVIQLANQGKMFGFSNNYRIYTLSNLTASKRFYTSLLASARRTKAPLQLTVDTIKGTLASINKSIGEIEVALTEFNTKKKVWVDLDPALDLSPRHANSRSLKRLLGL